MNARVDKHMNDIVKSEDQTIQPLEPSKLLELAIAQGADINKLEKLMALQERWEKTQAQKQFHKALSLFKTEAVSVDKNKNVKFKTQKGVINYDYTSLSHLSDVISPILSKFGLSYNWRTDQSDDTVSVTCVLSHEAGHSESTTLSSEIDTSGGKNDIQALGSAVSYLQRYTLKAMSGIAEADQDDDGAATQIKVTITEQQALTIHAAITEHDINMDRFMKWLKRAAHCETIETIPAKSLNAVMNQIKKITGSSNEKT